MSLSIAIAIPLLKKQSLDPDVLSTYRPVSNLPQLSKPLEKVVANQLMYHTNNMSDMYQSAYRKHHSTETALLCVTNDIKLDQNLLSVKKTCIKIGDSSFMETHLFSPFLPKYLVRTASLWTELITKITPL